MDNFSDQIINNYNGGMACHDMSQFVTPGDRIASIEEYEAGTNAFDDGDVVRSTVVGDTSADNVSRMVTIQRRTRQEVPNPGDIVIGTVAAVMNTMIAVAVKYINGHPTKSSIECICSTRHIRRKYVALVNDVVVLRILSHMNGAIHATVKDPSLGVILTRCVKCGGAVVLVRDVVKCIECSWIDERKLSRNYGQTDFLTFKN